MKTYFRRTKYILFILLSLHACTNLDEEVYDQLTEENFYRNERDILAAVAPVYAGYRGLLEWRKWWDFEETTDVVVTPRAAWFDGGIYIRLNNHSWRSEDPHFSDLWSQAYGGISDCNRVIYQINKATFPIENKEVVIAELELARAYWYYILCEAFGNVPLIDRFDVEPGYLPATNSREEVFAFIEASIKNNADLLSEDSRLSYGRFNKFNAKMLLARLYLNAEAWIGKPMYDACETLCDEIMASGKYSLEPDYSAPFAVRNENSPEIIFAYPNDEVKTGSTIYMALQKTLHPSNVKTFNLQTWLDNGVCAVPSFIDHYAAGDHRLEKTWRMGQQYGSDGSLLYCTGIVPGWDGKPLIYTQEVSSLENGGEAEGYRCGKYEIEMGTSRAMNNDWVAMRYAEIYFMKAECILRLGKDANEAAALVNAVRKRSVDTQADFNGTDLTQTVQVNGVPVKWGNMLLEWGREFALEGLRRSQLIRFEDNYTRGEWRFHKASQNQYLNLFPIPFVEMQANPNLKQNLGYN